MKQLDFEDIMDLVMDVQSVSKYGWRFYQEEREDGLALVAKHRENRIKVEIENEEDLISFCMSGKYKNS